jgi:hypothetical protein
MASEEYALEKLKALLNRQNTLTLEVRELAKGKYQGVYINGYANGFGYFEYSNGDKALGYWRNGMMDSEENSEQACVFYRATYGAYFFGLFKGNCAVEGGLFLDLWDEGKFMKFQELLRVDESAFWTKIMTPPPIETTEKWIETPLDEYVVLHAWIEHFSKSNNTAFEWRYYKKDKKMYYCGSAGPLGINGTNKKEIADARYNEIISMGIYTITFQKIDFSGADAVIQETRRYSDAQSYLLKDNEWKYMKLKALLKALPKVISSKNPA